MARNMRLKARTAALIAALLGPLPAAADVMQTFQTSRATPQVLWALPVGENDVAEDEVDGISIDPAGNTIISGVFRGSLVMGGSQFDARGPGDVFVASIGPSGGLRWVRHYGGTGDDNTFDLTTDGAGNIYLSGWFANTISFGDVTLQSAGSQDMFLVKLDSEGRTIWARRFGGAGGDGGNEISVASNGEIAVAAISDGDFTVDGETWRYGGGERDGYLMRLTTNSDVRWVVPFNGPGTERIRGVDMNDAGEVFVGFQYRGIVSLAGQSVQARGGWDGAIAKLGADGRGAWIRPVGGGDTDNVRGVGAGPDGSVYISGEISGPAILIDREVPAIGSRGDEYLARLDRNGGLMWVVSFGGPGIGTGAELVADPGGVIVSSLADRTVTVRLNREVIGTLDPPSPTSYIAGFTAEGAPRFVYMTTPGGRGSGALGDVLAVSPDGRFLAQGLRFRGTITAAGRQMTTPSQKDSAVVFFQLNGG